jgi:hypothetical protein
MSKIEEKVSEIIEELKKEVGDLANVGISKVKEVFKKYGLIIGIGVAIALIIYLSRRKDGR